MLKLKTFLSALLIPMATAILALQAGAEESKEASKGYQKPGAPVRLMAEPIVGAEPGDTLQLRYQFLSPSIVANATVHVSVDEGLQHNAAETYDFDLSSDDFALNFEATAAQAGVYYVRFMVEINGRQRALGQRIQVGQVAAQLQKSNKVVGGIMSMPAQESIRKK